jgi:hypothetical protein
MTSSRDDLTRESDVLVIHIFTSPALDSASTQSATAHYDAVRLIAGLAVAVVLGIIASRVVATTDWRPPGEGDPVRDDGR